MNLDPFDMQVLAASGNAHDLMKQFYGVNISLNNANKQMTGIRRHIRHKKRMEDPKSSDLDKLITKEDGSQVSVRMLMLSEEERKDPDRVMDLTTGS